MKKRNAAFLAILVAAAGCESSSDVRVSRQFRVSDAIDIDDRGRVLVMIRSDSVDLDLPAIWEDGVFTRLPYPATGELL
jgi:hypothetical protein